jgi:isoleucyl-tRNA synthetase
MENNNFIILNTTLTDELISEGNARELISKIQQMRKNKDFNIVDRIDIYYEHNDELEHVLKEHEEFIKKETLCKEFVEKKNLTEEVNINGLVVKLDVVKK